MGNVKLEQRLFDAAERLKKLKLLKQKADARARTKIEKEERRADAHRKIQLGGLVILAGADTAEKRVILGWLLLLAPSLEARPDLLVELQKSGQELLNRQALENIKSFAAQTQN